MSCACAMKRCLRGLSWCFGTTVSAVFQRSSTPSNNRFTCLDRTTPLPHPKKVLIRAHVSSQPQSFQPVTGHLVRPWYSCDHSLREVQCGLSVRVQSQLFKRSHLHVLLSSLLSSLLRSLTSLSFFLFLLPTLSFSSQ